MVFFGTTNIYSVNLSNFAYAPLLTMIFDLHKTILKKINL